MPTGIKFSVGEAVVVEQGQNSATAQANVQGDAAQVIGAPAASMIAPASGSTGKTIAGVGIGGSGVAPQPGPDAPPEGRQFAVGEAEVLRNDRVTVSEALQSAGSLERLLALQKDQQDVTSLDGWLLSTVGGDFDNLMRSLRWQSVRQGGAAGTNIGDPGYGLTSLANRALNGQMDFEAADAGTVVFSFGIMWWGIKSGGLAGTFLAGIPALRQFDPLGLVAGINMRTQAKRRRALLLATQYEEEEAIGAVFGGNPEHSATR